MSGWSGAAGAGPGPYRWVVVGNGENRRVGLFVAAAEAAGVGTPRVVEWRDVLRDGGHGFADDEVVRLDSPGENAEVDRLLRGVDDPTRVEGSATWYTRFLAAVGSLRGGLRLDQAWSRGAEAYLGTSVHGFPNLFLLYGPNTNLGHNSCVTPLPPLHQPTNTTN